MNKNRSTSYINSFGPSPDALKKGFTWLFSIMKDKNIHEALFVVNGLGNMDGVSEILGEDVVKALKKNKVIKLSARCTIKLATERDFPYSWKGPILGLYTSNELIDKIDRLTDATDVLIIPWTMEDIASWIRTWSAQELNSQVSNEREEYPPIAPVVEAALRDLTGRINLTSGITHPSDKACAIQLFQILVSNGIKYNPEEVRAWLVSKGGWRPDHANEVEAIAAGCLQGKRYRTSRPMWKSDVFNAWKQ